MPYCKYCSKNQRTIRGDEGFICCEACGTVLDSDVFSSEVTFYKTAGGQSQLSGNFVNSIASEYSESHERTLNKGRDEISYLVTSLGVSGGNSIIDEAFAFYRIALDKNFTRGRRTSLVAASCLYIACRENKKPFLLIDFSEELRVNVYVLGVVFLQLCELLRLQEHPIVQKLVDPSLFIHRFTERLLGGKNVEVSRTALRILASMKRDWMQTGRKPSGLCGAALYVSALSLGIKCSKSAIGSVVHVCEATLTKRLIEFENTESGNLTIEEFNLKADELEKEARKVPDMGEKSPGTKQLLCQHKDSGKPHFAHGLCKSCYDDFIEISGGLQGGLDPPAFQRAERQRAAKSYAEEKTKESNLLDNEVEPIIKPGQDVGENEKLNSQLSKNTGVASDHHETDSTHLHRHEDMDNVGGDESENLSDIDDAEVDWYLHNEEETRCKKIIWEEMNREYLEEQKLKKEAEDAAPELAKSRKKKRPKKSAEATNAAPAETPAEATCQMLAKKMRSSKINYDALKRLFEEDSTVPMSAQEKHTEYVSNYTNEEQHTNGETDFEYNDNKKEWEHRYGEEDDLGKTYGGDFYQGSDQEEYGYYGDDNDYGY